MIEVILDASQLEAYEPCNRKWYYSYFLNLKPRYGKDPYRDGSYWHEVLAYYYSHPNTDWSKKMRAALEYMRSDELRAKFKITDEELKFHLNRFTEYCFYYFGTDDLMEVIAVEQGFSYLLYEDAQRRFIAEGKIDLIARFQNLGLAVMDHKTQSRFSEKWEFNHQVLNYFNFVKPDYFQYNYIGLQDKVNKNTFHRTIYQPWPGMLEQWQKEVTVTYNRFASAIDKGDGLPTVDNFPRCRSACTTQYGVCQYHKLCSVPDNSKWVPVVLSAYVEKESKWRAWS